MENALMKKILIGLSALLSCFLFNPTQAADNDNHQPTIESTCGLYISAGCNHFVSIDGQYDAVICYDESHGSKGVSGGFGGYTTNHDAHINVPLESSYCINGTLVLNFNAEYLHGSLTGDLVSARHKGYGLLSFLVDGEINGKPQHIRFKAE